MDYKKIGTLLLVGFMVLAAMVVFVGPDQILSSLESANMNYIILAIGIQFVILSMWNIRWSMICDSLDIPHRKILLFAMNLVGLTVNDLTPSGRTGGEPVRAYLLSKSSSIEFKRTFASVMGDKIFDTFPFLVLAVFAISYLILYLDLGRTLFFLLLFSLVLFLFAIAFIIVLCFNENFGVVIIKWAFRQINRFTTKVSQYEEDAITSLLEFQNSLKYLLSNRKLLVVASFISFSVWILELLRVYIIFLAFGIHVSVGMIAAVFLVSSLVGVIPTLPGGLGSIDGVMVLLYSMAGITSSVSTAATLVERMISLWMVLILGLICLPFFGTNVLDQVE